MFSRPSGLQYRIRLLFEACHTCELLAQNAYFNFQATHEGCGNVEQCRLIGRQCVILQQHLGIRLDHALGRRPRLQRAEMGRWR